MISKKLAWLFSVFIVIGFCSSCGGDLLSPSDGPVIHTPVIIKPACEEGDMISLNIHHWDHFVESFGVDSITDYDTWFEQFAIKWGAENCVEITVVPVKEPPEVLDDAINNETGPDLIEVDIPPSKHIDHLRDLTELNLEAQRRFGPQVNTCTRSTYDPQIRKWYGFCHAWVPDLSIYRYDLWGDDLSSYSDLLWKGQKIKNQNDADGQWVGIGISNDVDSNMAVRAIIWSFGGAVQDENGMNVVLHSPETVNAVEYMVALYESAIDDERAIGPDWKNESNNNYYGRGELSYILNSISAYRSVQRDDSTVAQETILAPPLNGPAGKRIAPAHVWLTYVIPNYVTAEKAEKASSFLLHFIEHYEHAVWHSQLYNLPAWESKLDSVVRNGWLDEDPFRAIHRDKLKVLKDAQSWTVNIGHPGPTSKYIMEVFEKNILTEMVRCAIRGMDPEAAVERTHAEIEGIFNHSESITDANICPE